MRLLLALSMALLAALPACEAPGSPSDALDGQDTGPASQTALYDPMQVVDLFVQFETADWQKFLENWRTAIRDDVPCSIAFRDRSFQQAMCRPKGNEGDWHKEARPQFVIRFNRIDRNARFLGLRAINLEQNVDYDAPIRDRIGMWLMREAGLKAPRVNHARVFVNGTFYGLYQNIEVVNREFLQANWDDSSGNLYENGLRLVTNEDEGDSSDLKSLQDLVESEPMEGEHEAFFQALAGMINVPQVLRLMAAEVVLPTWDNFTNGSWNYYLYNVPGSGFEVIPWDLDDCLSPKAPVDADPFNYLRNPDQPNRLRLLMDMNPEWHQAFIDDLVEIRDKHYRRLPAQVDFVCDQIRDIHATQPEASRKGFDKDCEEVKTRITQRLDFLKGVLGR